MIQYKNHSSTALLLSRSGNRALCNTCKETLSVRPGCFSLKCCRAAAFTVQLRNIRNNLKQVLSDFCRTLRLKAYGGTGQGGYFMDSRDDIMKMLDHMIEAGVSRIKVEVSEEIEGGKTKKAYHHGRCDVGSPFATGQLFDLEE